MTTEPHPDLPDFPTAVVRDGSSATGWLSRSTAWFWLLATACLVLALFLAFSAAGSDGPRITVRFQEGHGLKPEDAVRYRGIDVGQVEAVHLGDDLKGVDVDIRLRGDAASVAREGSQFWIERPQISLSRMSGLDTVVGAKYVGVIPGPPDGAVATNFAGLENPPRLQIPPTAETNITIHFANGNGISAGDVVKYRGIIIGEVTDVRLQKNLSGVIVTANLTKESRTVARKGSVFWVERAQVSLQGVRGLDTLVGGQYLAVQPGPIGSVPMQEFDGADDAPASFNPIEGGLAVRLTSDHRFGLDRGAAVTYRGLSAGQVTSVSLGPDAHKVQIMATIRPEYRALIRTNTEFWNRSGVDFHIGLRGVDMEVDPLSSLAAGGIAFATPAPPGPQVESGHHFELAKEEPSDWADWRPNFESVGVEETVGRGQRILNRIRAPFGGGGEENGEE